MSVRSKAQQLAAACRAAMPEARVQCQHSRKWWGCSSYVAVLFYRRSDDFGFDQLFAQARVSDHGIGQRRFQESTVSLYLAPNSKPEAWAVWLAGVATRYAKLGGRLPAPEGLFA